MYLGTHARNVFVLHPLLLIPAYLMHTPEVAGVQAARIQKAQYMFY